MTLRLLVDANVPRAAAQSTNRIIGEKTTYWGSITRRLKVIDHVPLFPDVDRFFRENIPYIPALAIEGRKKGVQFFTYDILHFESWNSPPPIDWADRDIRLLFELQEIPFEIRGSSTIADGRDDTFDRFLAWLEGQFNDDLLRALKTKMSPLQSRDCCHVYLAHRSDIDGFVTLDGKFIGPFNQISKSSGIKVRCYSPKEICKRLRIDPVGNEWFSARADTHITYEPA